MEFIVRVIVNSLALWFASLLLSGMEIAPATETWHQVLIIGGVGLVFTLVNLIIKPIVKVVAFPIYLLTLGLFSIVVNAGLLWLTAYLTQATSFSLELETFWTAILAAIIVSIATMLISAVLPTGRK